MNLIADWIEQKIQEAIAKGEFENLPGAGKPIVLDDDSGVPPEHRVAFRVLKNSGFLPPELMVLQEIQELKAKIANSKDMPFDEFQKLKKRLSEREIAFSLGLEKLSKK